MGPRKLLDQRPGPVAAAVVDQQHHAAGAAAANVVLLLDQFEQRLSGSLHHQLLVVARDDEADGRALGRSHDGDLAVGLAAGGLAHQLASRYRPASTSTTPAPALSVRLSPSVSTAPRETSTKVRAVNAYTTTSFSFDST